LAAAIFLGFSLVNAAAQTAKPATVSELATYAKPDREQILYAGAKVEGKSYGIHRLPAILTKEWSRLSNPSTRALKWKPIEPPGTS
jgi:hypothetical protein